MAILDFFTDKGPGMLKSLFEVTVTVGFTFVPFFFLSIKWLKSDGGNTQSSMLDAFWGFWQAGEIVLPIFGLCGAVAALLALNVGYFSWWVHAVVGIIVLIFTIAAGAALIGTEGMKKALNPELIYAGFFGYLLLAVMWWTLAAYVRTTEPRLRTSDRNARTLIEQANAVRDGARDRS